MDETWFSDDEFDHLPDTTLLALEQSAITSTQKQPAPTASRPLAKQAHNASSFHKARSNRNVNIPWRPPQRLTQARAASQDFLDPLTQPHADEDDGENVIDLADDDATAEWSQSQVTNQRKVDSGTYLYRHKPTIDAETAAAFAAADAELTGNEIQATNDISKLPKKAAEVQRVQDTGDHGHLYARIAELEAAAEEARLAQARIKSALEAKTGEIDIVRANAEKERKEHDRRLQALQRNQAQDLAKHRQELEAGRKEREKMQTDNRFLQHDLAQEADRAKRLNGPTNARSVVERDTPRKSRKGTLGDGFDDNEVRTFSPSRSREKRRDSTPRAASKRKRTAPDSPVPSLAFAKTSPVACQDSMDSAQTLPSSVLLLPSISPEGKDIRFIQRLLAYRPLRGRSRAIEILALHNAPTESGKTLSSILMDSLSTPIASAPDTLPLRAATAMLQVWAVLLEEQEYSSVKLIVDIIGFFLRQELPSRYNTLAESLVSLCNRSLELVSLPVVRAHINAAYAAAIDQAAQRELSKMIDAYQITDLLSLVCDSCTLSEDAHAVFWRSMNFPSLMLLIHKALPMDRIDSGLKILYASATENSFGAIQEDQAQQEQREVDTVYRLTLALFEIPTVLDKQPSYDGVEIAQFRIALLDVLTRLCEFDRGSLLLARHTHFVGQLARFLDEQIRKLYALPPSRQQFSETPDMQPDQHDLVVQTINMSMRIMDHLLTRHDKDINLGEKFGVVTGGYHKFLISMTRIAFVEQPTVFEYGIAEDVIEAAHSILDAFLTPEDGEAIAQALETPQASKGQGGQKRQPIDEDAMDTDPPD